MKCTIYETLIMDAVEMDGARLGHSPSNNTISACLAMTLEGVAATPLLFSTSSLCLALKVSTDLPKFPPMRTQTVINLVS